MLNACRILQIIFIADASIILLNETIPGWITNAMFSKRIRGKQILGGLTFQPVQKSPEGKEEP